MNQRCLFVFFSVFLALSLLSENVDSKTRISVTAFENKAGGGRCYCSIFGPDLGTGMADQLITKLSDMGRFEILERETIKQIYYGEHELINADPTTAPERNKFRHAHYTVVGAITSFELCSSGGGANVNVGRLLKIGDMRVGGKSSSAKVVIDMRVIDVTTGEVLKSVKASGKASSVKFDLDAWVKGVDFGSDAFYRSPIGEATRDAISDAAKRLGKVIPERSDAEPTQVQAKRTESTQAEDVSPASVTPKSAEPKPAEKPQEKAEPKAVAVYFNSALCKSGDCKRAEFAKLLTRSDSGENIQIYNYAQGEKQWVKPAELYKIKLLKSLDEVKIGGDIYLRKHDTPELLVSKRDLHSIYKCTILDKSQGTNEIIADCYGEKETKSYPISKLYRMKR